MNCIKCGFKDSLVLLTSALCVNHECDLFDKEYALEKGYSTDLAVPEPKEDEASKKSKSIGMPYFKSSKSSPIFGANGVYLGASGLIGKPQTAGSLISYPYFSFPSWDLFTDYDEDASDDECWPYEFGRISSPCSCTNPYCNICNNCLTITASTIIPPSGWSYYSVLDELLSTPPFTIGSASSNMGCKLEIDFC